MELVAGIEPATSSLPRKCSTTELHKQGGNRRGDRQALRKGKVGSLGELISCWIRPEIVSTTQVSLPHAFSHCVADCISLPPSVKRILGKNFEKEFCGLHPYPPSIADALWSVESFPATPTHGQSCEGQARQACGRRFRNRNQKTPNLAPRKGG